MGATALSEGRTGPKQGSEKRREGGGAPPPIAPPRLETCSPLSPAPPPPLSFSSQEPDYIHAPSMYDIPSMTNRKLKFGLGVGAVVLGGFAVPAIAANHQQRRAAG